MIMYTYKYNQNYALLLNLLFEARRNRTFFDKRKNPRQEVVI